MTGTDDRITRSAQWLVGILLALLLVPGIIGFEAWPMTGWRLFSASRDATQTKWVVQAVDADGASTTVSLEELPLAYRNAEWRLAELPSASEAHRQKVCRALAEAVVDVQPDAVEVQVAKDSQVLVQEGDDWIITHSPDVLTSCEAPA